MINVTPLHPGESSTPSTTGRSVKRRMVRCEVIVVSPDSHAGADLLPWADPYIASLMAKLEREEQELA